MSVCWHFAASIAPHVAQACTNLGRKPRAPAARIVPGARTEVHRGFLPLLVERFEIIGFCFDLGRHFRQALRIDLSPRDRPERLEDDAVRRLALAQPLVERGDDLDRIVQQLPGVLDRDHR